MLSDTVHMHIDQAHHVPSRSCMKSRQPVDECLVLATSTPLHFISIHRPSHLCFALALSCQHDYCGLAQASPKNYTDEYDRYKVQSPEVRPSSLKTRWFLSTAY